MLAKRPGRDEPLRPQPRAKPKRKEMRTVARAQGEWSGPLESAGGGDVNGERPRKRRRVGCHTEWKGEETMCAAVRGARKRWCELVWYTRAHHKHAATVQRKMKDGTAAETPLPQRSLRCPCCPAKRVLEQCLAMHLQAKRGQPRREQAQLAEGGVRGVCGAPPGVPKLARVKEEAGLQTLKGGELFFGAQLASFLKELFEPARPSAHKTDEPELRPARSVKSHCLPTVTDAAHCSSAAAKLIRMCVARPCESVPGSRLVTQGNLLQRFCE
ncbi:hypothetical protein ERJ75_001480700 [Trypanosoma vivax]|nr:hypothetical protein ERJ75_001480700 [Trypanosoma vivax]